MGPEVTILANSRSICIVILPLLAVGYIVALEQDLERDQIASLQSVHYADAPIAVLPDDEETARFRKLRASTESRALDDLDKLYGERDRLKALALHDTDDDGVPDFRVSDYFGKFMEGDVDLDGDGVRNVLDSDPFDRDLRGVDANANGMPDSIDWSLLGRDARLTEIQLGLYRDHGIALVDRNARFDLVLAEAVDDTVRRVFRHFFENENVLPTLRTIAREKTALLNATLAAAEKDETAAQVFPRSQSLIIYDVGRGVDDPLLLLGLLVHEMGHSFHMSLDFDAEDLAAENARTRFPAPRFVELIRAFEWEQTGFYEGELGAELEVVPRFVYTGMSEPTFSFRGKDPEAWASWAEEVYQALGETPTYLLDEAFASRGIVSDDALSLPSEWYADNLIAYVVTVIEVEALETRGTAAQLAIDNALRAVWPTFYHRNLAPDIRAHFETTFPITESDRRLLAERYIEPIVANPSRGR